MKLLMVVPYVPNAIRVRPWQLIRTLVARGHDVTLGTLWTTPADQSDLEALAQLGIRTVTEPMTGRASALAALRAVAAQRPIQCAWSWSPALFQRLGVLLRRERFDAIHVEHLRGSRYAEGFHSLVQAGVARGLPSIVWDSVDSISSLFAQAARSSHSLTSRAIARLELGPTRREEGRLAALLPVVSVTSEQDRDAFLALAPARRVDALRRRIQVIPNGVDLDEFHFQPLEGRAAASLLFSGKLSYHANSTAALHLVRRIMPLVWSEQPDVELRLVGKDPPDALIRVAAEAQSGARHVVVTGAVASMGAALREATVATAPLLYGAGIQNKVLEAMACGTPVVASSRATAALAAVPGRDLLVADEPEPFSHALLHLLASPDERCRLGQSGRAYVEHHHSWSAAAAQFESLYAGQQPAA